MPAYERVCLYCKTPFVANRKDKVFCRRLCKQATKGKDKYKLYKGDSCECCGFVAIHKVQLDVDHIDGNHFNNDPSNLQTLCANCHRLKTFLNGEYMS
ncbi:hypothetical protein PJKIFABJ_00088 [Pseudomonas phage PE09]|uniref:HNH nuclease domain-containing protein n=2 Tax=Otagovirus TaxID=2560197 RepID=A0A9E6KRG0_9CAUD|nr:hypothetical protein QGX16_gp159 [Pseudomonas phage phiPsa397]YP_010768198.1 hypothetical protein QGX22_gp166 [Pseudomonas phage PE09]QHZ60024.1 hypothetical protein PJKIFABJ_00088 [Pseudomonas phage PE09]QNO00826.1 hypothetical protein phiPsa397_066 [Pseudomonas phage phiPsa397]